MPQDLQSLARAAARQLRTGGRAQAAPSAPTPPAPAPSASQDPPDPPPGVAPASLPLPALRQLAADQIARGHDAVRRFTGMSLRSTLSGITPIGMAALWIRNGRRWAPFTEKIDGADKALVAGDEATDEAEKRRLFARAYADAYAGTEGLLKEAGSGETSLLLVAKEGAEAATEVVKEGAKAAAKALGGTASDLLGGLAPAALWLGLGYLVVRALRS